MAPRLVAIPHQNGCAMQQQQQRQPHKQQQQHDHHHKQRMCRWRLLLGACLLHALAAPAAAAVRFDPCEDITPITRGSSFVVGLAFWPGGTVEDWGPSDDTGLNPCNTTVQANLTALGAMFATFSVKADRLSVLKTSFPEELILTGRAPSTAPRVISMVAFRGGVRSEARYAVSFEPAVTSGTGFVSSLTLISKFERGTLNYLQFYNLTCNDCGGRLSTRCLKSTSCALSLTECTCPPTTTDGGSSAAASSNDSSSSPAPSPLPASPSPSPSPALGVPEAASSPPCTFANFSFCATGVNVAFEGTDAGSAAFSTAGQVKKLNSFSLVSLYYVAKQQFFDVKDLFADRTGEYWGKFGAVQSDINAAYSGNAAASVDAASSGMVGR